MEMTSRTASPPRVLLLGADGMLGRAWRALMENRSEARGDRLIATNRQTCDISDAGSIRAAFDSCAASPPKSGPTLVINCAAYSDVDGAESNEAQADQINGPAVGELARCCAEAGALLVHYSTDYVFNGRATSPYPIDTPRDPINAYGRTKAHGESLLEASSCRFLLVRTSWLYASWGKNFVITIANLARQRPELRVVDDQQGRPTSVEHLARTTLALVEQGAKGIRHVTDGGECTWYEFARRIAGRANSQCRIEPCTSDKFPRPATRPPYSVLDLTETEADVGPMPHWSANLDAVLDQLEVKP